MGIKTAQMRTDRLLADRGLPTRKSLTVQVGSGAGRPKGIKEAREPGWRWRLR